MPRTKQTFVYYVPAAYQGYTEDRNVSITFPLPKQVLGMIFSYFIFLGVDTASKQDLIARLLFPRAEFVPLCIQLFLQLLR